MPTEPLVARKLEFGKMFTPNFFVAEYRSGEWRNPRIQPLEPFSLHPASMVFHYCQTIFEGLKAYRHDNGRIVLFRPELNAARFRRSAERMRMPDVSDAFFLEAVQALVENERHFVPAAPGCLYIRPVLMGVDAALGVKSSNDFIFFIMTLPSGPYFKDAGEGPGSINVMVTQVDRALGAGADGQRQGRRELRRDAEGRPRTRRRSAARRCCSSTRGSTSTWRNWAA